MYNHVPWISYLYCQFIHVLNHKTVYLQFIFLQISEQGRYPPDNPNITFEGVTIHSLNLKLASTLIVLLFEVGTDISILF